MYIVKPEQMKRIDEIAIREFGIPSGTLMEKAGRGVAMTVKSLLERVDGNRVAVVCGQGNNGGDGWVCARYLLNWGYEVEVVQMGEISTLKGDSLENARHAIGMGISFGEYETPPELKEFNVVVDALVGTGFRGAPRGALNLFINAINQSNAPVVSVDIPSGVDGENGKVEGSCVRATVTVTFAFPKLGLLLWPARHYVGSLKVVDIGIPPEIALREKIMYETNDPKELVSYLPFRPGDGHKGTFGKGVIIAGGLSYTGAPFLACEAFLRSGAGYAVLGIPRSLYDIMASKLTETVIKPLPEVRKKRCLSLRALGEILAMIEDADSLVVGPGLGRYCETMELVQRLLMRVKNIPVLVDADALFALGKAPEVFEKIISPVVFSPHPGELSNMLGIAVEDVLNHRLTEARNWAKKLGGVLIIKGNPTVIASEESERIYLNLTGNDGMATAGSGDVLSGLIGGFLAQKVDPLNAARIAVYLHGLSGDIAVSTIGRRSLIATDILNHIPHAIQTLENGLFDPEILF